MDLARELRSTQTEETRTVVKHRTTKELPVNEVQEQIRRVCFDGMHYNDVWSAIGKLASGGIGPGTLLANANYFDQFIAEDSATMKSQTVGDIINRYEKYYQDQVGSRPFSQLPADCFSVRVYENLPPRLADICLAIEDPRKRDVALVGIITALSAAFTRYRFYHGAHGDVKQYSPHIISLALGAAGSGKGNTRYGMELVELIAHTALEMHKQAMAKYKAAKMVYDAEKRRRDKECKSMEDYPEPERPPKYRFAMSASDTTQAALVEILNENPQGGFAYDSEVDTMVQGNNKRDFGGFSDVIRKVFHHEPLARQRKGEGESYIVYHPRLAVMLSGTHDQLRKLIPSEYNGLFSRIWYYSIPKAFLPYAMSEARQDIIGDMCRSLQLEVLNKADLWSDEIIELHFSPAQEIELFEAMKDKKEIEERHGGDIGASWLRMALIVKRIAVTLAGFESVGSGVVPEGCWRVAIELLPALKTHCIQALDTVRMNMGKLEISEVAYKVMSKSGMSDKDIAKDLGVSAKTLQRRKAEWTK